MKQYQVVLVRLLAVMAFLFTLVSGRRAQAYQPRLPVTNADEPLSSVARESMTDDPQAVLCVIEACTKNSAAIPSVVHGESQLRTATLACFRQHLSRKAEAVKTAVVRQPIHPDALTCRVILGKSTPAEVRRTLEPRALAVNNPTPTATLPRGHVPPPISDELGGAATAVSQKQGKASVPAGRAMLVSTSTKADKSVKMDKKTGKNVSKHELVSVQKVIMTSDVPSSATESCEPSTFEVRKLTKDGLDLFVKPGATMWQLQNSCWAKKFDTSAKAVILANKAEKTIPWCAKKPKSLPAMPADFEPTRLKLGQKGGSKIGDEADKAYVDGCDDARLGYGLQAGQVLHLAKKSVSEPASTNQQPAVEEKGKNQPASAAQGDAAQPKGEAVQPTDANQPDAGAPEAGVKAEEAKDGGVADEDGSSPSNDPPPAPTADEEKGKGDTAEVAVPDSEVKDQTE